MAISQAKRRLIARLTSSTGGGSGPTPSGKFIADFAAASYSTPAGAAADLAAFGLSITRPSPLTIPDASGVYLTVPAGTIARNNVGLWRRGRTRTNKVPNNKMNGAAVGTPGTYPTGWIAPSLPSGLTGQVVAFGAADPDKGLPYIDVRISGTAAAGSAYIQFCPNTTMATSAGAVEMASVWLKLVAGTLPIDGTSVVQPRIQFTGGTALDGEVLMNRDTVAPRRFKTSQVNPNAATTYISSLRMSFKAATVYDFTIRIIAPQAETIESINGDASWPILTDTGPVTAQADTIAVSGAFLAFLQGGAGSLEITTSNLRASGIDYRSEEQLIGFNGNIKALKRTSDGRLASDLPGAPQTYKSWRSQFDWSQKHALSWTSAGVRVASSSPKHASSIASATQPAISAVTLDFDGCLKGLTANNAALADVSEYLTINAKVVVYGATSGGVTAAAGAISTGSTAAIVGGWREVQPGGMSSGGLGSVDASTITAFGGMSIDFLSWCNEYAHKTTLTSPTVDPINALRYFDFLVRTFKINQHWSKGVVSAAKDAGTKRITGFGTTFGQTVSAKNFIDASYEGDLLAAAGVSLKVGREAQDANNAYNGNRGNQPYTTAAAGVDGHQFTALTGTGFSTILNVDPYVTPGTPASGLIQGIQSAPAGTVGVTDAAIQAYNFRMTLTTQAAIKTAFVVNGSPPPGYDPARYELAARYVAAITASGYTAVSFATTPAANQWNFGTLFLTNLISAVYDINSNNGFSTDTFGANWGEGWAAIMTAAGISSPSANFAVGSYAEREIFWKWQENYLRGYFYFLAFSGDSRIPAVVATDAGTTFGLAAGYYLDTHENDSVGWMTQLYIREARRLIGMMTLNHTDITATDGSAPRSLNVIAMLSYAIDSHHVRRYVDTSTGTARVINEGNIFISSSGDKMAPIAAEYITPTAADCTNLFVTFACSAEHTGFGALRMELAHMATSQSAGIMAGQIAANDNPPDVQTWIANNYNSDIRPALLAAGQIVRQTN